MMQINRNNHVNIKKLVDRHWGFLKRNIKRELLDNSQIMWPPHTTVTTQDITDMEIWVEKNLYKIVTSTPKVLWCLHLEFKDNFKNIHDVILQESGNSGSKPITDRISKVFDYEKFFASETLTDFYESEEQELKQLSDDIRGLKVSVQSNKSGQFESWKRLADARIIMILENMKENDPGLILQLEDLRSRIRSIDLQTNNYKAAILRQEMVSIISKTIKELRSKNSVNLYNYSHYRKKHKRDWSPYHLVLSLRLKVCPFCNRQYISTTHSRNGKTRPDLDHFLPKSKYPYFALSFYNLIPCCKVCNSSFKGVKDPCDHYVHPYVEGFDDKVVFTYTPLKEFSLHNPSEYIIDIKPGLGTQEDFWKRAKSNIDLFQLVPLYNMHKDVVGNLFKLKELYNEKSIEIILKQYAVLFPGGREELMRVLLSNYVALNDTHQNVLSKLTRDIAKQLHLI